MLESKEATASVRTKSTSTAIESMGNALRYQNNAGAATDRLIVDGRACFKKKRKAK